MARAKPRARARARVRARARARAREELALQSVSGIYLEISTMQGAGARDMRGGKRERLENLGEAERD